MIYGYIRVSTDVQTVENQRFEIEQYAIKNSLIVNGWIEETISGTKAYNKRAFMIMEILNICMQKECKVWTIKDGYRLGDDIQSKVLAFAFGLSAEIERNLISQRTKEALARKKAEGTILGRPKGAKSSYLKLSSKDKKIRELYNGKVSKSEIARILGVHRITVSNYIKRYIIN